MRRFVFIQSLPPSFELPALLGGGKEGCGEGDHDTPMRKLRLHPVRRGRLPVGLARAQILDRADAKQRLQGDEKGAVTRGHRQFEHERGPLITVLVWRQLPAYAKRAFGGDETAEQRRRAVEQ
jgi:hypothetical protein